MRRFADRRAAGRTLGSALLDQVPAPFRPIVLALPRGGVPVGFEVARALAARLDVLVVRKVGAPGHAEFGIGAIAERDVVIVDRPSVRALGIDLDELDRLVAVQRRELHRRIDRYRTGRDLSDARDRDIVLVDDGLATGVTAEAAIGSARRLGPRRILLAVPVAAPETVERLASVADDVIAVWQPRSLRSVGEWYEDFTQTSDAEVIELLARSGHASGGLRSQPRADE